MTASDNVVDFVKYKKQKKNSKTLSIKREGYFFVSHGRFIPCPYCKVLMDTLDWPSLSSACYPDGTHGHYEEKKK